MTYLIICLIITSLKYYCFVSLFNNKTRNLLYVMYRQRSVRLDCKLAEHRVNIYVHLHRKIMLDKCATSYR